MQGESYRKTDRDTTNNLSEEHHQTLVEGSGNDPQVSAERGVRTITEGRELPREFSWRQKRRGPGVLFKVHRPNGETSWVFRPDEPDPKDPGYKYCQPPKSRGAPGNVLDVHPSQQHLIDDVRVPVLFTEGIKKGDSTTSAARAAGVDLLVVTISGVWNWLSGGEPIPDMYDVPVDGRRVYVCFDSDLLRNPNVQEAAERLAEHLAGRGAEVWIVYLPDQPDGSKTGADDFLAAGGTLEELLALARPFDPGAIQREKLSKNERLRRALKYLARRGEELPAKTRRDCSKRATLRACLQLATRRGKLVEDGVEVRNCSTRTGAELAAMSQPTFSKCLADLVEDGYLRRIKRQRSEEADSYVLLVPGGVVDYQDERGAEQKGESGDGREGVHRGDNVLPPLPELRWSKPGRKARRGVARGTRKVRQGRSLMEDLQSLRRLGKKRGEIVRYLVENGGSATRDELLEAFGGPKTTWRDFRRQTLADLRGRRRQYRGQQLSVGPPIIELDDEGIHLAPEWADALERHRELGAEQEAAVQQKIDHLRQRAAYRARNETKAGRAPTEEEMASEPRREERQKRRRIDVLVAQGMSRMFALREVLDVDGFIGDLRPAEDLGDRDLPDKPVEEEHGLDCECLGCSAPQIRYATPFGGAS